MQIKGSIVQTFEHAFFCLYYFALGTSPGIRHIFPCCPAGNPIFWVSLYRIKNIVAFQTYPTLTFFFLGHINSTPCDLFFHSHIPLIFMNALHRAIRCIGEGEDYRIHDFPSGVNTVAPHEEVPGSFPQG